MVARKKRAILASPCLVVGTAVVPTTEVRFSNPLFILIVLKTARRTKVLPIGRLALAAVSGDGALVVARLVPLRTPAVPRGALHRRQLAST